MPLPSPDTPWPPKHLRHLLHDVAEHDAWYSGDRHRLKQFYGGQEERRRPSEGGGWVQRMSRWLWGSTRRGDLGQPDERLHIPLAGDIAGQSADLLFGQPVSATIEGDSTAQDRLTEILDEGHVWRRMHEAAQVAAALGGAYLIATWDESAGPRPVLTIAHEDQGIPTWNLEGNLRDVVLWREVARDGQRVFRFLECHEPGAITYGLYEGTDKNLGRSVQLTAMPDLAESLGQDLVDGNRRELPQGTGLTVVYLPNVRPRRSDRGSWHGQSDFIPGLPDLFNALDATWTSWMRDLRLGRSRLVVPDSAVKSNGAGQGADFDADREIWSSLVMDPRAGEQITQVQFAIRAAEHQATAEQIVRNAVSLAGYSPASFGLAGEGVAITATEVDARASRSAVTRQRKIRYISPALGQLFETMLQLDRGLGWSTITPARPTLEFDAEADPDLNKTASTIELLRRATVISVRTSVEMAHPDWDADRVEAEVLAIQDEQGMSVPDPTALGSVPIVGAPAVALPPAVAEPAAAQPGIPL